MKYVLSFGRIQQILGVSPPSHGGLGQSIDHRLLTAPPRFEISGSAPGISKYY